MPLRTLPDALDEFTAAAFDCSRWQAAMDTVADAVGAYGAALFPVVGDLPNFPRSQTLEESSAVYISDGWFRHDERFRGRAELERKGVVTEFDFITPGEMARHPYYQEFLAPHRLRWFAGVKMKAGEDLWSLSLQRTIEQGPFSPSEQNELVDLSERLRGVGELARALRFGRAEGAMAAFDATDTAIALLDRHGEVLRVNPCAERMFGPELDIVKRRLASADPNATAALDRALHKILWTSGAAALRCPVQLPRRERRPIFAYPIRLPAITIDALSPCQAVVVLIDLEKRARPPEILLRACFGLTVAEARLATQIAGGKELAVICETSGISRETARAQLRAVFTKTETHRQSELVALLGNFATLQHT